MIRELCFHHCDFSEGQTGFCRARACRDEAIVPLNYGKVTSLALDPVEKKPLRRFTLAARFCSWAASDVTCAAHFARTMRFPCAKMGNLRR